MSISGRFGRLGGTCTSDTRPASFIARLLLRHIQAPTWTQQSRWGRSGLKVDNLRFPEGLLSRTPVLCLPTGERASPVTQRKMGYEEGG